MSAAEFRRFGHEIVDWIANYFEHIEELPVLAQIEPGDLKAQLPASPPEAGEPMATILADVDRLIVPALTHWSHPSFFAYFATSTSAPGIFGELLSAAFDVKSMLWRTSPASTELEEVTLDWLRQMLGLDAGMSGFIYDTASVSSMHAIAAAREGVELRIREEGMSGRKDLPLLRVYASEQAHSSIDKGIITLGLRQRSLRKIPTDKEFRMDAKALADAIDEDKRNRILPFCVVATVGTTSTSSIDPVPAIVEICEQHKLWLHVDAAYGGALLFGNRFRDKLRGVEAADSLSIDFHKLLWQPIPCSAFLLRDARHFDTIKLHADYLNPENHEDEGIPNLVTTSLLTSRRFDALKLWISFQALGRAKLAAMIDCTIELATHAAEVIRNSPRLELVCAPELSTVIFRFVPSHAEIDANRLNAALRQHLFDHGIAVIGHTRVHNRQCLKLTLMNPTVREEQIQLLLRTVADHGEQMERDWSAV